MITLKHVHPKIREVLHLGETPQRTAVAFALGIFIAFTPTYGLHFVSVVSLAWAFRLNFPALLLGSLVNNPWTIAPILGATMWTGFFLLGMPEVPDVSWKDLSMITLYESVRPFILPFTLGALTLGVLAASLAYPLGVLLISWYRTARNVGNHIAQKRST